MDFISSLNMLDSGEREREREREEKAERERTMREYKSVCRLFEWSGNTVTPKTLHSPTFSIKL